VKKISLVVCLLLTPVCAIADADAEKKSDLVLSIRRVGLDLSNTDVKHAAEYSNSPIQALKANSQDYIKGVADIALEYDHDRLNWDNALFTEYGKTTLKPYNAAETSNENADKILASSDLAYACWDVGGFKLGPTARMQYETEFTSNGGVPRQNVVRSNAGVSLFDHDIIKNLYLAGVYEYDFTYRDEQVQKSAAEFGWRLEYQPRQGVKFTTSGYYREYLSYSRYLETDLKRDLNVVARMDTNLWNNFTMGPYVQYRLAKSREADVYGSNFILGVSFNYITKFGLF
jgi:hypothetical protein